MALIRALGQGWDPVNATHMGMIRQAIDEHGGTCIRTEGDAIFAVFPEARAAVGAAIDSQRALSEREWPAGSTLRVRMGLHSGEAYLSGDDYGGFEVNRAARVAGAGHGGQIVMSDATRALVEDALPDGVTIRDLGRHELRGLPRPEGIHQLVVSGLRSDFPPLRTAGAARGNLPDRMTSFLGRDRELNQIHQLLESHRLVTITGPGGIGKTSLAIEAVRSVATVFADGAWFVELESVVDPTQVRAAIARTLGLFDGPEHAAADALLPYLGDRDVLLVLDNFEHLMAAATDVGQTLRAAPRVRIIVTSRAPLRVSGEQEVPLEPLPTSTSTDASVRLFEERARSVRPSFDATADLPAIGEVCDLLDGLPLGIELAAARVAILPVTAIRDRLSAKLPLPGAGKRDVPDRQRTLDGAIAWSYNLLAPERQRLLRDLSVFEGSFELEQAQALDGGDDVLESLVDLIDQSLLARDSDGGDGIRFRLLRTIQTFALLELRSEGREDQVRRRHALAFTELAEGIAPQLPGGSQRRLVERLRQDHANLTSALHWAIDSEDADLALRLVGALWRYWQLDGHLAEGAELAALALAMPGGEAPTKTRLGAVTAAGGIAYWQGRQEDAAALYDEQLDLARRLGDRAGMADASFNGIFRQYLRRDFEAAGTMLEQAHRLYEEVGDAQGIARLEWVRGTIFTQTGRPTEGKAIFEQAYERFVASGDTWYEALALGSLAWAAFGEGDARTAIAFYVRSILLGQALGDMATTAISLEVAAIGALELGQPENAATLLGALETACLRYGVRPPAGLGFLISTKAPRERLREVLDEPAIARWMEVGRRMSLDDAVELFVGIARDAGLGPSPASSGSG